MSFTRELDTTEIGTMVVLAGELIRDSQSEGQSGLAAFCFRCRNAGIDWSEDELRAWFYDVLRAAGMR